MSQAEYREDRGIESVTILVVDDQISICNLIESALKRLGFKHVLTAADGCAALEILEKRRVDILMTDWVMKGMDGITLTRLVRGMKDSKHRMIPIILMSGLTTQEDVKHARDCGITEFMSKPFNVKQMCDRIMAIVEKPRDFVVTRGFSGPDRRRTSGKPVDKDRRRRPGEKS